MENVINYKFLYAVELKKFNKKYEFILGKNNDN